MLEAPATIPFAWWNTKLAPPSITSKATANHRIAVSAVVRALVERHGCLFAALAEVRRENVLEWIPQGIRTSWDALTDTSSERHDFDVAIVYNRTWLTLMDHVWVRDLHAGNRVRAGLVATFGLMDGRGWIVVAAAHWRADASNADDADARRSCAAEALRRAIGRSVQDVGDDVPVLVLGDFNAEPFAAQFRASLPTARSRDVVRRHRPRSPEDLLFYNAAWRWLGERYAWDGARQPPTLAGTYRVRDRNVPAAWRTFDQVLVSPSLLRGSGWSLDERALGIHAQDDVFDSDGACPRAPFDHLPILGRLQWFAPPVTG